MDMRTESSSSTFDAVRFFSSAIKVAISAEHSYYLEVSGSSISLSHGPSLAILNDVRGYPAIHLSQYRKASK
jgi:hypothetical protein